MRSAAMLLHHIGEHAACGIVEQAIKSTTDQGIMTRDLHGTAGTREFAGSVLSALKVLVPRR
jgi:isocitrate/isopropylmalate dehydrogenase